jgi:hypothetical protein
MERRDLLIAPAGEAALILIVGIAGYLARQPLIFASLGPTAYELIETPHRRSARPYSIFIGHLVGIGVGYLALFLTGAWRLPAVTSGGVPFTRVWASVLAAGLTVLGTLLLRASQPAAIATSLLISTGIMQKPHDAAIIMVAVVLMIAAGEPLRKLRLKAQERRREREAAKHTESHS